MKRRYTFVILLATIAVFLFWLRSHKVAQHVTPPPNETNQLPPIPAPTLENQSPLAHTPGSQSNIETLIEQRQKEVAAGLEKSKDLWRTPIEFYGLVVDENTNPVSGAKVDFDCNDLSPEGTSSYHTVSDTTGLFSIRDIKGKGMAVTVSKEGYYPYAPFGRLNFEYAGENENFVPNPKNPVIFRLRKKGTGETLIHFDKGFSLPKDGTPILIDLASGTITSTSENSFKVECWTFDTEKKEGWKYDWKCRISVPGGGLQIYDEQFPFLAPEAGYVPADEIDMPVKPNTPWSSDVERHYFVRMANGDFGRLTFRMIAHGDHFCRINSYLNPTGSRNLEPK